MRLILEKSDLIEIIAKHFDARVDPDSVIVRHDPFEVELKSFDKLEFAESEKPLLKMPDASYERNSEPNRADPDASAEPPAPVVTEEKSEADDGMSPLSVLARSQDLKNELDRTRPQAEPRRAHSGSTEAPGDFHDEIT